MNRRSISILSILLLLAALWFIQKNSDHVPKTDFNRHPDRLIYTKHARCRMDCRFFTEAEVQEILDKGNINYSKSRLDDEPCPSYALEGITSDGQDARIIFATCDNNVMKVVTCIDLGKDYDCHCN